MRCAITKEEYNDDGKLEDFNHKHLLFVRQIHIDDDIVCYGCQNYVQGTVYGCDPCLFYLHESCAELPRQVYHPLLDKHMTTCGFSYRFGNAKLSSLLNPSIIDYPDGWKYQKDMKKITHFSHEHHFFVLEVTNVSCKLCYKIINGQKDGCKTSHVVSYHKTFNINQAINQHMVVILASFC